MTDSGPRELEGGRYRAPHTVEIPFVFHNLEASPWTRGVAGAAALAEQVSDAWLAFARSGDPNTRGLPRWPAFDAARRAKVSPRRSSRALPTPKP